MSGGDRRDEPWNQKASIRIAYALAAAAIALVLIDPFLPNYEPPIAIVASFLTTACVLLGWSFVDRKLPK